MRSATVFFLLASSIGLAQPQPSLTPAQQEQITSLLQLPPGSSITLEQIRDGGSITIDEEATGTGAALRASGDQIVQDHDATAPTASLGGGRDARGSDTSSSVSARSVNLWGNPLLWLGLAGLLVAGLSTMVRPPTFPVAIPMRATMTIALLSASLVAAALFPGIMLFIVAGAGALLVGAYLYREFKGRKAETKAAEGELHSQTLRSVAAGIADFKLAAKDQSVTSVAPEAWEKLKGFLSSHVEPQEAVVIEAVRAKDGLA